MEIINGTALSDKCDYSFGDHYGGSRPDLCIGGFMKEANEQNVEFLTKCREFEGKVMTLFIDNIRLYRRNLTVEAIDAAWVKYLLERNDLLALCAALPKNKFVIFCSHEDTPIDSSIQVPENVLGIHAVNAEYYNDKIHPFPYGIQRQLGKNDKRGKILKGEIDILIEPKKLLYINCGIGRNKEREPLVDFEKVSWATTRFDKDSKYFPYERYRDFLDEMRNHKFMLCPQGHGMDCHRNWESLYMRRVPIMRDHSYFRKLMQGLPVLFVQEWSDISKELLEESEGLYHQAQVMSLKKLDLDLIFKTIINSYETNHQ